MFTIETIPSPLLRKVAGPVKDINERTTALIDNMFGIMSVSTAVGLAAPQMGVPKAILVWSFETDYGHVINPNIVAFSGEMIVDYEGCLSIPNIKVPVSRSKAVIVNGFDIHGEQITIVRDNYVARVLQHEIDHLNGVLMIDRANEEDVPTHLRNQRIAV